MNEEEQYALKSLWEGVADLDQQQVAADLIESLILANGNQAKYIRVLEELVTSEPEEAK